MTVGINGSPGKTLGWPSNEQGTTISTWFHYNVLSNWMLSNLFTIAPFTLFSNVVSKMLDTFPLSSLSLLPLQGSCRRDKNWNIFFNLLYKEVCPHLLSSSLSASLSHSWSLSCLVVSMINVFPLSYIIWFVWENKSKVTCIIVMKSHPENALLLHE